MNGSRNEWVKEMYYASWLSDRQTRKVTSGSEKWILCEGNLNFHYFVWPSRCHSYGWKKKAVEKIMPVIHYVLVYYLIKHWNHEFRISVTIIQCSIKLIMVPFRVKKTIWGMIQDVATLWLTGRYHGVWELLCFSSRTLTLSQFVFTH